MCALVNHVVSGNLCAAELAAGGTIEGVGDRLDGDILGPDPAGSYAASANAAAAVFRRPGVLDAPCAVSYGPVPGSVYAGHRFIDLFIPGWDLAAATGQDTALDADLMQACQQVLEPQLKLFRGAGAFAGPLPVPPGASGQTHFLARLGRAGGRRWPPAGAPGLLARAASRERALPADVRGRAVYERLIIGRDAHLMYRPRPSGASGGRVHINPDPCPSQATPALLGEPPRTAVQRAFSRCFSITQCDAAYQLAGIRSVADGPGQP